jgi:hypothetical protein
VSVLPLTRRTVDVFDHPGLFMVPLDRPRAMPPVARTLEPAARPGRARVASTNRPRGGLHRYCSGCSRETEHVPWTADRRGSIPRIRWPAAELGSGTTICLNCGQWRAASSHPSPPAWSSWPRSRNATRRMAVVAAVTTDDWVAEAAAENEGMPPKRGPRHARSRSVGLRRVRAVAR